jgi:hypothetical protein
VTARRTTPRTRTASTPLKAGVMSAHDCTVLALLLIERLSLTEAALALDLPVTQVRRDYERALKRVRRAVAPLLERADLSRALGRPAPAWRRAS